MKPMVIQLNQDTKEYIKQTTMEPKLREWRRIDHKSSLESLKKLKIGRDDFLTKIEKKNFLKIFSRYDKNLAFASKEIICVDPNIVAPMVIFIIPYVPWNLKPNSMPKALLFKLIDLLKEKG